MGMWMEVRGWECCMRLVASNWVFSTVSILMAELWWNCLINLVYIVLNWRLPGCVETKLRGGLRVNTFLFFGKIIQKRKQPGKKIPHKILSQKTGGKCCKIFGGKFFHHVIFPWKVLKPFKIFLSIHSFKKPLLNFFGLFHWLSVIH